MPLQTTGSISFSEIATEFGDTTPNSMSEFYKNGSLVPSQRAITGSESYTSLVTGDQIASTGIYVNGVTASKSCTNATFAAQTTSDDGGDEQFIISNNNNTNASAEDAATTITIASGTYVNITIRAYQRYYVGPIANIDRNILLIFWGNGTAPARDIGIDWVTETVGDVPTTGVEVCHEFTAGQSSDFAITNSTPKDLSAITRFNYTVNSNNEGFQARPAKNNTNAYFDVTIKGYATQATTLKMVALHDFSSAQDAGFLAMNGPATGTDPDAGGTYNHVTQNSSLTMNQFKAYNNNSYALSVNGTSIPANTPSGSAVLFKDNLLTPNVTASVTGNQPLNADVPTSGTISFEDFYGGDDV